MWNLHFFRSIAVLTVFSGVIPAVDAHSSMGVNSQAGATVICTMPCGLSTGRQFTGGRYSK